MTRWGSVAGGSSGDEYQRRFDRLAASGASVHGEADFVDALLEPGSRVLDAGCGTGRVAVELARRGHDVLGVDVDPSMLAVARRAAPELVWLECDLSSIEPSDLGGGGDVDLVVLAGNVVPLMAAGTEPEGVRRLGSLVRPGGLVVAGFGIDVAHLPLDHVPVTLADYEGWCSGAGLELVTRCATWGGDAFTGDEGYAVSVHRRTR